VSQVFLRLGFTAFGGPAAHIAMMRREMVERRAWVSDQYFLDMLGATYLIPGPNSTELAIHLGFVRAGWKGLIAAGTAFILPAMLIVLSLAWLYVQYGTTTEAGWLLYGVKPVIIAILLQATWGLGKGQVGRPLLLAVGAAVCGLYLAHFNEIALLLGSGVLVALIQNGRRMARHLMPAFVFVLPVAVPPLVVASTKSSHFSVWTLFLTFLKIGAVLYGSGYVLLAFLRTDFVERLGWLTNQQLVDAVAVGQFTPGPVFTTATFIGYLVGGFGGAIVATVAIFLPSFVFVAAIYPLVPRLRRSQVMSAFLDGVNVAALGLILAVTWQLGQTAIIDWLSAAMAVVALGVLLRFRLNSAWLVAGGALVGLVSRGGF
jgi:chromate transporter